MAGGDQDQAGHRRCHGDEQAPAGGTAGACLVRGPGGERPYERSFRLCPRWPTVAFVHTDLLFRPRQREMALDSWKTAARAHGKSSDVLHYCPWSPEGNGQEASPNRRFKSVSPVVALPDRDPRFQWQAAFGVLAFRGSKFHGVGRPARRWQRGDSRHRSRPWV